MRRLLYMAAEWLLVYLFCVAIGLVFLCCAGMYDGDWALLSALMTLFWIVASIPFAARLVLLGPQRASLAWGFYRPTRPIATAARAGLFEREDANRTRFSIAYRDVHGRDPFDIVRLLAAELEAQGITHSYLGHISVADGVARWRVEPALDGDIIEGWVEADDPRDRRQIVEGLKDFLADRMSLKLEDAR